VIGYQQGMYRHIFFVFLGESTLRGGHFGHFHDMYVMYISAKHVAFNFGFHFWYLGLIF
jgi:hypothetical protein